MACSSTSSTPPPTDAGAAWGFFAYAEDFAADLSHARVGRITQVLWPEIEPVPGSGAYDWSELDARFGNAQRAGFDFIFVLKPGNGESFSEPGCFAAVEAAVAAGDLPDPKGASCPITAPMESAWTRMVTELVERYDGDGDRDMPGFDGTARMDVEIENEADSRGLWDYGETDREVAADHYLHLLALSYEAVKAADPATQVILGGLHRPHLLARCDGEPVGPGCDSFTLEAIKFSKRVLARPDSFDAVDVHFFTYYHFDPEFIDDGFQWVVGQMQQHGYERPIYVLESSGSMIREVREGHVDEFNGYFPYSADFATIEEFQAMYLALDQPENVVYRGWFEAEQAKELPKLFSNVLALGARRLIHTQYSDYHGVGWDNPWWNWQGVIKYVDGVPIRKPSYYTYNVLSERLFGFATARRIEAGSDVRLYEFTFPTKDPTYVLWTDGADAILDLSPVVTRAELRVTHLVTELDVANEPVVEPEQVVLATVVPVGDVPVLLEGVP